MASLCRALWSVLSLSCLLETHARVLVQDARPQPQLYYFQDKDSQQQPLASTEYRQILRDLIDGLDVMQDEYFVLYEGTWPTGNDWTRAVHGTHVSATLAALTASANDELLGNSSTDGDKDKDGNEKENANDSITENFLALENLVSHFFAQVTTYYFGENALGLRDQAYDDMLWVVLGWLENIKFQRLHSDLHFEGQGSSKSSGRPWHGTQFQTPAAHRARIFYELASNGWDTTVCGGGMIWNPHLGAYKNAITNELYISSSIGMYLYFPGDPIDAPFVAAEQSEDGLPHDPSYLEMAQVAYSWLKHSNMTGIYNLYADGFHVRGYQGPQHPGTGRCDVLNTMVYTYNQGVILSGLRGLWLATGSEEYLADGHELIQNVQRATGWPNVYDQQWKGLGRAGIMEDTCDSNGDCSQDGQTFKGIFWHHFAEFCRPFRPQEERFLRTQSYHDSSFRQTYDWHQKLCSTYRPWIEHNAEAALVTRNEEGKFGMWWGRRYREIDESASTSDTFLPDGAVDYRNHPDTFWSANTTGRELTKEAEEVEAKVPDYNDRGRGRTVETQSGGVAVLRALYQWKTAESLG
ncbi:putative glycosyl hydrolase [Aspergillus mulundensis]|uniref:Glycosyl hydrolase n=1 Tax=Aspergillus mulundensis TaxID=1810919 RepID=A0A3D8Q6W5_9EURO|nr:Uncharacterized protein DSM5745_11471 [Aspergillus mulundensis]RDW57576.1 Uncharacterized protein DSM5745_11471 [Aspergillus mulundensis]